MSVHSLRAEGAAILADAGIDSAGHDAALLLAAALDTEPGRLLLVDEIGDDQRSTYRELIARRANRIPLQHVLGTAHFYGLDLAVGPGVFIPRPETEMLAHWGLDFLAGLPDVEPKVADLCSGSGALALALATGDRRVRVRAVEYSAAALGYLRQNVAAQPAAVADRVTVVDGDVTDADVVARLGECALIVANPPYVPRTDRVSPEVLADPADAVFSGDTGMDVIDAMIPLVADALAPGGGFGVEHDDTTGDLVCAALRADGRFTGIEPRNDLAGRPRFVTARRRA